ncbi:MAG: cohesin domain-containing protein [Cyclonatronaceae bacterium]
MPVLLQESWRRSLPVLLLMLLLTAMASMTPAVTTEVRAETVNIAMPDTILLPGDEVLLPVAVTAFPVDPPVYSGEFMLDYNRSVISVDAVETAGTLLEGAGDVIYNITTGRIAFAATEPLWDDPPPDAGVLVYLRIRMLDDAAPGTETDLTMQAMFNEGEPTAQVTPGLLRSPQISISPQRVRVIEGEQAQFSVSGDVHPPVSWSVTSETVATIDGDGLLTGHQPGTIRVFVEDQIGLRDSTELFRIEPEQFRLLTVSTPDTSVRQTREFWWPIQVTDVTGLDVTSVQFDLRWSASELEFRGISADNTLLEEAGFGPIEYNAASDRVVVAVPGLEPLEGEGPLIYLQFRVRPDASGNLTPNFAQILFNEDITPDVEAGQISIQPAPVIEIFPDEVELAVGESQTLSVTQGGSPPYTWESADENVVVIDEDSGELTGTGRGTAEVYALDSEGFPSQSAIVTVYDVNIRIADNILVFGEELALPVTSDNLAGLDVFAYEMDIAIDTTMVQFGGVRTDGTLSEGMSVSSNVQDGLLRVAAAGTQALGGDGTLLELRFTTADSADVDDLTLLGFERLVLNDPGMDGPTARPHDGSITFALPEPPGIPVLIAPENEAIDVALQPEFRWDGANAQTFDLQLSTDEGFDLLVADLTGLSQKTWVPDFALDEETTYWWRVRGVNIIGESDWVDAWRFTTQDDLAPPPDPPRDPSAPEDGAEDVPVETVLSWFAVADADSYRVQIALDDGFSDLFLDQGGITDTSLAVTGLDYLTTYHWRVRAYRDSVEGGWSDSWRFTTKIETAGDKEPDLPSEFMMSQNYPNPFNPSTQIRYTLPEASEVRLEVFNLMGQRVDVLVEGQQQAGAYDITFDASHLSSGIYLYRLQTPEISITRRMILLK